MFKINRLVISLFLCGHLMAGCVAKESSTGGPKSPYGTGVTSEKERQALVKKYLDRGRTLENEGRLTSALEQYKLALTVAPDHSIALENKTRIVDLLRKTAQLHYERGLEFDKMGQYEAARNEYLRALQNRPGHQGAKERLTGRTQMDETGEYIVHTLRYGESVSIISNLYYDDVRKYDVIGKFNNMKDVTKVNAGDQLKIPAIRGIGVDELKRRQAGYLKSMESLTPSEAAPADPPIEASSAGPSSMEAASRTTVPPHGRDRGQNHGK